MTIFIEVLDALAPMYLFLLIGSLLRLIGIIPREAEKPLNRIVFNVFLPVALFMSVVGTNFSKSLNARAIVFSVIATLLNAGSASFVSFKKIESPAIASVIAQGIYRTNFGLLGVVYASQLFGASRIGPACVLIAIIVPLFNVIAVISFVTMDGSRPKLWSILLSILKNPLVLAVILGAIVNLTGFTLPSFLRQTADQITQATNPIAMIVVGSALTLKGINKNKKWISIVGVIRLLLIPAVMIPLAVALGFRDVTLLAMLIAFGGPVAISLSAMAYEMGADGELAAQIIAVTTIISLFTLHLFIVLLRSFSFL